MVFHTKYTFANAQKSARWAVLKECLWPLALWFAIIFFITACRVLGQSKATIVAACLWNLSHQHNIRFTTLRTQSTIQPFARISYTWFVFVFNVVASHTLSSAAARIIGGMNPWWCAFCSLGCNRPVQTECDSDDDLRTRSVRAAECSFVALPKLLSNSNTHIAISLANVRLLNDIQARFDCPRPCELYRDRRSLLGE